MNIILNQTDEAVFFEKLANLDLSMVKMKVLKESHYNQELVDEMADWYKKFLFLNFKYPDLKIVPNDLIDEFWHQHILDTQSYWVDCNTLFGYFLHHFPYFGLRGEDDRQNLNRAYEETKMLFISEFGELPFMTKGIQELLANLPAESMAAAKAASCSDCSGAAGTGT